MKFKFLINDQLITPYERENSLLPNIITTVGLDHFDLDPCPAYADSRSLGSVLLSAGKPDFKEVLGSYDDGYLSPWEGSGKNVFIHPPVFDKFDRDLVNLYKTYTDNKAIIDHVTLVGKRRSLYFNCAWLLKSIYEYKKNKHNSVILFSSTYSKGVLYTHCFRELIATGKLSLYMSTKHLSCSSHLGYSYRTVKQPYFLYLIGDFPNAMAHNTFFSKLM